MAASRIEIEIEIEIEWQQRLLSGAEWGGHVNTAVVYVPRIGFCLGIEWKTRLSLEACIAVM